MIGFYNYTVIATYCSLFSSVFGIICAVTGKPIIAVFCLMVSGALDSFDGAIARTKKDRSLREIRFGIQIDSLSDLVCFGVLPAVIGFSFARDVLNFKNVVLYLYAFCAGIYVLGGLIRLAVFNNNEEEKLDGVLPSDMKEYTGLPITLSSLIFPIYCFISLFFKFDGTLFAIVYSVLMLAVAFAFVSKFKIKKPPLKGVLALIGFGAILAVVLGFLYYGKH